MNKKYPITAKVCGSFLAIALVFSAVWSVPQTPSVEAQTMLFTRDLTMGSQGADVVALQTFLEGKGFLVIPVGVAKGYFGVLTRAALARYQASVGISPAAGYFGPITRAHVNAGGGVVVTPPIIPGCPPGAVFNFLTGAPCAPTNVPGCPVGAIFNYLTGARCGTSPSPSPSPTDDDDDSPLQGGAGSASYSVISGLNNEEVGEGEDDVEVAGLEVEADEDSDIELTAVRLVFNEGTADQDFEDYASDVSIWLDGEEFARVDADEFTDESGTANDWTKTITLDDGAIIRAGDTEDLVVRVSGIGNLDSADEGDTWTVDISNVRFRDAMNVSTSEDPAMSPVTFSFETFATANDLEMRVNLTTDNPDEDIVVIDNEGDEIPLLNFRVTAEGSDLTIQEIPIALTAAGVTDIDDLIDELVIEWNGDDADEASESILVDAGTTETVTFDDLELVIPEGDTVEFTVSGRSAVSTVSNTAGVTLRATVTPDNIIAEDDTGEDLGNADISGSATGETQHIFSIAPEIRVTSTSIVPNDNGNAPAESAKATINFQITARGGTVYLNGDNETTENKRFFVGQVYGSGINAGTVASTTVYTLGGNYTVTNSGSDNEYYTLNEDDTMTIRVEATVAQTTTTSDIIKAGLKALMLQYGIDATSDTTRSAIDLDWTDLTDQTQTGTVDLTNPS